MLQSANSNDLDFWFMRPEYDGFPGVAELRAKEQERRARKAPLLHNETGTEVKAHKTGGSRGGNLLKSETRLRIDNPPTPQRNGIR